DCARFRHATTPGAAPATAMALAMATAIATGIAAPISTTLATAMASALVLLPAVASQAQTPLQAAPQPPAPVVTGRPLAPAVPGGPPDQVNPAETTMALADANGAGRLPSIVVTATRSPE